MSDHDALISIDFVRLDRRVQGTSCRLQYKIAAASPGEKVAGVDRGICNPAAVAFFHDALLYPDNT